MTRMKTILVLSLLSLASLGVAQSETKVDCGDETHCPEDNFCSQPPKSSKMVCVPQQELLCEVCVNLKQTCIGGEGLHQVSCQKNVSCDQPCADTNHVCIIQDRDTACLPQACKEGPVDCGAGDGSFCPDGSYCVADDKGQMLCAQQTGNDVLCAACDSKNGQHCYTGDQPGQLACLEAKICSSECPSDKNYYCLPLSNTGDGLCLSYSEPN